MRVLFAFCLVLSLLSSAAAQEVAEVVRETDKTYVGGPAPGRTGPRGGLRTIAAGRHVLVLYRNGEYSGVLSSGEFDGCEIKSKDLRTVKTSLGACRLKDRDGWTYLRSGPGKEHPPLEKIPVGDDRQPTLVFLLGSGEWSKVLTDAGREGYIHRSRLQPFSLDASDDADKRSLVKIAAEPMLQRSKRQVAVFCGYDRYYIDPKSRAIVHLKYPKGAYLGRYQDWAVVVLKEIDESGAWLGFGGSPSLIFQKRSGRWVYRGDAADRVVGSRVSRYGADGRTVETDEFLAIPKAVMDTFDLRKSR